MPRVRFIVGISPYKQTLGKVAVVSSEVSITCGISTAPGKFVVDVSGDNNHAHHGKLSISTEGHELESQYHDRGRLHEGKRHSGFLCAFPLALYEHYLICCIQNMRVYLKHMPIKTMQIWQNRRGFDLRM